MSTLENFQKQFLNGLLANEKSDSRLDVYRTIVAENHKSALSDTYPVCEQLVGSDYFKVLAWNYLRLLPPSDPDLNLYGEDFPVFLGEWFNTHSPYKELFYLQDIAALEWVMYFLQHKPEVSEKSIEVNCNALDIWKVHQGKFDQVDKKDEKSLIIVRREGKEIFAKTVSKDSSKNE